MRRDNQGPTTALYVKTTGVTFSVGWSTIGAVPTGTIQPFGGTAAPSTDWLICDGTAVSRTFYAALFAVIGTAFGGGDGSTTFNLPDLRGRVPAGFALSGGHGDVSAIGNNEGSTLANRRPKHPHSTTLGFSGTAGTTGTDSVDHTHSGNTGGESATHTHGVTDPGHSHGVPTYSTGGTDAGDTTQFGNSFVASLFTDTRSTGISLGTESASHTHAFTSGGRSATHTHNITPAGTITGGVGPAGTANDAPAYLVVNFIIKT
jgi:microcystin-dependent protein